MDRIFRTVFVSAVASWMLVPAVYGVAPVTEHTALHKEHHEHHEKMVGAQTAHELAKECETRLNKIKEVSAVASSLAPDLKAEFEYNLDKASLEIKYLQNPSVKDFRKHANLCNRDVGVADHIIKKHEHQLAHEKKMEDRKAKALERKAKRDAMKAHKASEHHDDAHHKAHHDAKHDPKHDAHHEKHHETKHKDHSPNTGPDNGRLEGINTTPPGTEAAKPLGDEKK